MNDIALIRRCPICDHSSGTVLHTQRFKLSDGHPLPDSYRIMACACCGFCFADTPVLQAAYDEYYAEMSKYADSATSTGAGVRTEDAKRLRQTANQVARFAADRSSRILDIGCANGGLLSALRAQGYANVCGMDPAPGCVAQARKAGAAQAWVGTLSNLPHDAGMFDGVVLSHVLEHVRDLRPALARVRRLLNPGGWVYMEVPDAMRYELFLVAPFQDFNTEHINHFSGLSLANLCHSCGFAPECTGTMEILSAQDMPYPSVFWFARVSRGPMALSRDEALCLALEGYINASRNLMRRIDANLRRILEQHPQVIVWGAGQLTMKLLADTCLRDADILAFVDGNPINHGKTLRGREIVSGYSIPSTTAPILVCSLINATAINVAIGELGLRNPVVALLGEAA